MKRFAISLLFCACIGISYAEIVKIGIYLHPPLVMKNAPDGEPYGPGVDYAKAAALAMGYEPKMELLPIARLMSYLKDGSIDMGLEFGMTGERNEYLLYSENTCLITKPSLTVRAEYPLASIKSIKDISGMRIGYILGAYPGSFFAGNTDVVFDNVAGDSWIAQNLGKLLAGRIDAILDQNEHSCLAEARRQGLENRIKVLQLPVERIQSYVVFSRASPKAESLLRAFNALGKSPDLDENALLLKYLSDPAR